MKRLIQAILSVLALYLILGLALLSKTAVWPPVEAQGVAFNYNGKRIIIQGADTLKITVDGRLYEAN